MSGLGFRRAALLALSSFLLVLPAIAESSSGSTASNQTQSNSTTEKKGDSYVLALGRIEDRGLLPGEEGFLAAFPGLLVEQLADLPARKRDEAYEAEKAEVERSRLLLTAGNELASSLDALALRELEPGVAEADRRQNVLSARKKVEEAREKLAEIESPAPVKTAPLPSGGPLSLKVSLFADNLAGNLLEVGKAGPAAAISGKGIDLLVYGHAEDSSGYVALSLSGYDAALGRELFSWRDFADPDDPLPLAVELAERLCAWVAGADYARIAIDLSPTAAYLLADGRLLGAGDRVLYRFDSGTLHLAAAMPGHEAKLLDLPYAPGDRKSVGLVLDPIPSGSVSVSTLPVGASLSLNGLPLGPSPLSAELSGRRAVLSASAPGFESASAVVPASGSASVELRLRPEDGLGPSGRIAKAKDGFYNALGLFVLSLPVASISYAVNGIYYEAAVRSYDETMIQDYYSSGYVFGAAVGISAAAAINTIVRLVLYIGATR
jgi:hypothetical protein